jgi:hypothetical protein
MYSLLKTSVKVLLIILSLTSGIVSAQNYEAVKTDASYYFYSSIDNSLIAISIDSVESMNGDNYYYNFHQIRPTEVGGCYTGLGSSWLGDPIIEKPGGKFIFRKINSENGIPYDSIFIKTRALLGDSWRLLDFSQNSEYIQGNITAIEYKEFIGLTDSVKIITLTHRDGYGQLISDPINNKEIWLSKNYGLIQLPKFENFPYLTDLYTIAGKTNPETGYINPTAREVFNFETGDEIHTKYTEETFTSSIIITGYTVKNIISKTLSPTDDWVAYRYSGCHLAIHEGSGFPTLYESNSFDYIDTIFYNESPLNFEPNEAIVNTGNGWMYGSMGILKFNRSAKLLESDNSYNYIPESNCWSQIYSDGLCPPYYITGLGGPYYNCLSYPYWSSNILEIIYYKKGAETWGTPLSCDSLQQVGIEEFPVAQNVNIYPNPSSGTIMVSIPKNILFPCKLELLDISGSLTKVLMQNQQTESFDLSDIPAGLYIYKLTSFNGKVFRGKIIRQ